MKSNALQELMGTLLGALPPTPYRFFKPRKGFWKLMDKHRGTVVVEMGAGRGDTTEEAKAHGFRWVGCDLATNDVETLMKGVQTISALDFPLVAGMTVIACRPDHSGWCEPSLQRALDTGCVAIYVGLEKNAERDLGDLYHQVADFHTGVGEEGECMWVWPSASSERHFQYGEHVL